MAFALEKWRSLVSNNGLSFPIAPIHRSHMRTNTSLQGGREHGLPVSLITMLPGEKTIPMIDQVSAGRNCIKLNGRQTMTYLADERHINGGRSLLSAGSGHRVEAHSMVARPAVTYMYDRRQRAEWV